MGITTAVQGGVTSAFTALSEMLVSCTLTSVSPSPAGYDPDTGDIDTSGDATDTFSALILDLAETEIQNALLLKFTEDPNDIKVKLKKALVPGSSVTLAPHVGDTLTFGGSTWDILMVEVDPMTALYQMTVRRS